MSVVPAPVSRLARSVAPRFVRRVGWVLAFYLAALIAVGIRAGKLQTEQHAHLRRLAEEQYLNTVKIPARRGHIYDRHGAPLAVSVDVPSVYVNPSALREPALAARALAPLLGVAERQLFTRLTQDKYFVWLKRQVTPEVAEAVQALALPGVGLTKEPRRFYPNREVGAQVIGFAGMDGQGLEGVEKYMDAALMGQPQIVAAVRDARGRIVLAGGLDPKQRARGKDVHLSLDLQIQHAAEQSLARVVRLTGAKSASAVVMEAASAEILAMAVVPTYNPNGAGKHTAEVRRNRIVTDVYEPGSTLKPLVVGAALDSGLFGPNATLFCENGRYRVGRHTINDTRPHAELTLGEVVAKSSNIGMAKIGQAMGPAELEASLRAFGLGRRTGVEFVGEVAGLLRPASTWSELETATIAFGQGIAASSLQLAAAYRVLAAEGAWRAPRLVRAVEGPDGILQPTPASLERPVIALETARRITAMLEAASGPAGGTGRLAAVPGYRVAGKTGTAQKADPVGGGYSRDRYTALFAGYLPSRAPRVVITVAVDEPMSNHYGGVVAAPVFAEIGAAVMQRLGVEATELERHESPVAAHQPAQSARPQVGTAVTSQAGDVAALPERAVAAAVPGVATAPDVAAAPVPGGLVGPAADASPVATPSFLGLSVRQAMQRFAACHMPGELHVQGSGVVAQQAPAAGWAWPPDRIVRLALSPP